MSMPRKGERLVGVIVVAILIGLLVAGIWLAHSDQRSDVKVIWPLGFNTVSQFTLPGSTLELGSY